MNRVDRLTYVGHATTLIEVDGVALLTDPVLRNRIGHIPRIAPRASPATCAPTRFSSPTRIATTWTCRRCAGSPPASPPFAPPAVAEILRRQSTERCASASRATPTSSTGCGASRRTSTSRSCRSGGWGPRLGPGHLDPEGVARAAGMLEPRVAIPIHWGTYASRGAPWRNDPAMPAREFERHAAIHAPETAVKVLAPGESSALTPAAAGG